MNLFKSVNWEGVGVIPDIKITAEEALKKAKTLAADAVTSYRTLSFGALEKQLTTFSTQSKNTNTENKIEKQFRDLVANGILNEGDINILGYNYLRSEQLNTALVIFKSNTLLFPKSANVYDSYAEALTKNQQHQMALVNYEKAVTLAKKQKDPQLQTFQNNLKALKSLLKE